MHIPSAYMASASVRVTSGPKIKGSPHIELEIGKGKGSRHSYLTPSEAREVAYALLLRVEQPSN